MSIFSLAFLAGCNGPTVQEELAPPRAKSADVVEAAAPPSSPTSTPKAAPLALQLKPVLYGVELTKVLDFTTLKLPEGTKVLELTPARASIIVPGTLKNVTPDFLAKFTALGWNSTGGSREQITDDYTSVELAKENFLAEISISKSGDHAECMVSLLWHGNLDTRKLPRLPDSTPIFEQQSGTGYRLDAKVADAHSALLKLLISDGWKEFNRVGRGKLPVTDKHGFLKVFKNGYELDVMVGLVPNQEHTTHVQYNVYALAHVIPVLRGATDVEFDDLKWELRCNVPGDFLSVAADYKTEMLAAGFKSLPSEQPQEKYFNQRFGSDAGDVLLVQTSTKDDLTHVSFNGIPAVVYQAILKHDQEAEKQAQEKSATLQAADRKRAEQAAKSGGSPDDSPAEPPAESEIEKQIKKQQQEIEDRIKIEMQKALNKPRTQKSPKIP